MNSTILVARVLRVLETGGAVGDGAGLAQQYSEAMAKANQRLEAVQHAIVSNQASDAVRMMEEQPRLLDEISTLDFNRLEDWDELCGSKGWAAPVRLDQGLLEQVTALNGSAEAVAPFLRMYRKAVRTNNNRLAMQSLRRLAELDKTQNWGENLRQCEKEVQRELIAEFENAKRMGDAEGMLEAALALTQDGWTEGVQLRGMIAVHEHLKEVRAEEQAKEGRENIAILRQCMGGEWNRRLVWGILRAIERLEAEGWKTPGEDGALVENCRERCAREMEEEKRERRWKELCEELHAAVEREDAGGIRETLGAPEFLDRDPPEELLDQARTVVEHDEAMRRRKLALTVGGALAGALAVVAMSGWWLKQQLLNRRCETEAAALEEAMKGPEPIGKMERILERLKEEAPAAYADSRVYLYEGRLEELRQAELTRTNELAAALETIESERIAGWKGEEAETDELVKRAGKLLKPTDVPWRRQFLDAEGAWLEHKERMAEKRRAEAEKARDAIAEKTAKAAERLGSEYESKGLKELLEECKAAIEEWRTKHQPNFPAAEGEVTEAEKKLLEAERGFLNMANAVKKVREAAAAHEAVRAREELRKHYGQYGFVGGIGDYPADAKDVEALTGGTYEPMQRFKNTMKSGVDETAFRTFIDECVKPIEEYPLEYSLYGICREIPGRRGATYIAVSKGMPEHKRPSYEKVTIFEGEIFDLANRRMVDKEFRVKPDGKKWAKIEVLRPCEELKAVVDVANGANLTIYDFENELLKLVDGHIKAAKGERRAMFEFEEVTNAVRYTQDRFPAIRRVQLMETYFRWIKDDLKTLPESEEVKEWVKKITRLGQKVLMDGVPRELTWTCMADARVRKRNVECAKLLTEIPENFVRTCRGWRMGKSELQGIADWKYRMAGKVEYDPGNAAWRKDMKKVYLDIGEETEKTAPLYVLRERDKEKRDKELALVEAVVAHNGKWMLAHGMSKELLAGEPLFQVTTSRGKAIDAYAEVERLARKAGEAGKHFRSKIPLFGKGRK